MSQEIFNQTDSNEISFTTNFCVYDSGHILFSGYESGTVTAEELAKINPTKKLKITAITEGGNTSANHHATNGQGFIGEKIINKLFVNSMIDIQITVGTRYPAFSYQKGHNTVVSTLQTLIGGRSPYGSNERYTETGARVSNFPFNVPATDFITESGIESRLAGSGACDRAVYGVNAEVSGFRGYAYIEVE